MWITLCFGDDIHVVPRFDERVHKYIDCWCNPTRDEEDEAVILHHALDRREIYETNRTGPNLQ